MEPTATATAPGAAQRPDHVRGPAQRVQGDLQRGKRPDRAGLLRADDHRGPRLLGLDPHPRRPARLARPARPGAPHGHLRGVDPAPGQGGHRVQARRRLHLQRPLHRGHAPERREDHPADLLRRRGVRVRDRPLPLARRRRPDARHVQPARDRVLRRGAAHAAAEAVRERRAQQADLGPDRHEHPGPEGARGRALRPVPGRPCWSSGACSATSRSSASRSSATRSRTRWTTPSGCSASGSAACPTARTSSPTGATATSAARTSRRSRSTAR